MEGPKDARQPRTGLGRLLGRLVRLGPARTAKQGSLGDENKMYFNKELGRWVEKGKEAEGVSSLSFLPPPSSCSTSVTWERSRTAVSQRYVLQDNLHVSASSGSSLAPCGGISALLPPLAHGNFAAPSGIPRLFLLPADPLDHDAMASSGPPSTSSDCSVSTSRCAATRSSSLASLVGPEGSSSTASSAGNSQRSSDGGADAAPWRPHDDKVTSSSLETFSFSTFLQQQGDVSAVAPVSADKQVEPAVEAATVLGAHVTPAPLGFAMAPSSPSAAAEIAPEAVLDAENAGSEVGSDAASLRRILSLSLSFSPCSQPMEQPQQEQGQCTDPCQQVPAVASEQHRGCSGCICDEGDRDGALAFSFDVPVMASALSVAVAETEAAAEDVPAVAASVGQATQEAAGVAATTRDAFSYSSYLYENAVQQGYCHADALSYAQYYASFYAPQQQGQQQEPQSYNQLQTHGDVACDPSATALGDSSSSSSSKDSKVNPTAVDAAVQVLKQLRGSLLATGHAAQGASSRSQAANAGVATSASAVLAAKPRPAGAAASSQPAATALSASLAQAAQALAGLGLLSPSAPSFLATAASASMDQRIGAVTIASPFASSAAVALTQASDTVAADGAEGCHVVTPDAAEPLRRKACTSPVPWSGPSATASEADRAGPADAEPRALATQLERERSERAALALQLQHERAEHAGLGLELQQERVERAALTQQLERERAERAAEVEALRGELDELLLCLGEQSRKVEVLAGALVAAGVDPEPLLTALEEGCA